MDLETIQSEILVDLAGDLETEPNHILDLAQATALLLIPFFRKCETEMFSKVLNILLLDVLGQDPSGDLVRQAPKLTRDLLRQVLECYGEFHAPDSLLDEMIVAAGGKISRNSTDTLVLNAETFRRALTGDIKKYGTDWDTRFRTHFDDVNVFRPTLDRIHESNMMSQVISRGTRNLMMEDDDDDDDDEKVANARNGDTITEENGDDTPFNKDKIKKIFTTDSIDTIADKFRSQSFAVILWVTLVVRYVCFL